MSINFNRVLLAASVLVVVIGTGLYFQDRTTEEPTSQQSPEDTVRETDREEPPASQKTRVSDPETPETESRLTVDGRILFPEGSPPRPLRVEITYLKTKTTLSNRLKSRLDSVGFDRMTKLYFQELSERAPDQINSDVIEQSRRVRTVRSDTRGRFRLQNTPSGVYRARVKAKEWSGETDRLYYLSSGRNRTIEFPVTPVVKLTGQVTDQAGVPISGATVESEKHASRTRTDENGQFTLGGLPSGSSPGSIEVSKQGFEAKTVSVDSIATGEESSVNVTLRSRGQSRLTVQVLDDMGNPVGNGLVHLVPLYLDEPPLKDELSSGLLKGSDLADLRSSRWVQSIRTGSARFDDLRPGPYQATLLRSDYVARPKTVKLGADEERELELRAAKSQAVTVRFMDEETGDPLGRIQPLFSAFDQSGRRLAPGLQVTEIPDPGVVKGVVPPKTHRLTVELNAQGEYRVTPGEVEFARSDFPDLTVRARLEEREETISPYQNVGLRLDRSRSDFDPETMTRVQVNFWNEDPPVVSYRETGGPELFDQTHRIRFGDYRVFGAIKTPGSRYTFLEPERIERSGKNQNFSFRPRLAGTLRVRASSGTLSSLSMIRLGLVPFEITNPDGNPPGPREYPVPLVRTLNAERTTAKFQYVPPNQELNLIVRKDFQKGNGGSDEKAFSIRKIPPLSPGETRTFSLD